MDTVSACNGGTEADAVAHPFLNISHTPTIRSPPSVSSARQWSGCAKLRETGAPRAPAPQPRRTRDNGPNGGSETGAVTHRFLNISHTPTCRSPPPVSSTRHRSGCARCWETGAPRRLPHRCGGVVRPGARSQRRLRRLGGGVGRAVSTRRASAVRTVPRGGRGRRRSGRAPPPSRACRPTPAPPRCEMARQTAQGQGREGGKAWKSRTPRPLAGRGHRWAAPRGRGVRDVRGLGLARAAQRLFRPAQRHHSRSGAAPAGGRRAHALNDCRGVGTDHGRCAATVAARSACM